MNKKLEVGDIFYLETQKENKYIFGRILFDVEEQYFNLQSEIDEESYFDVYEDCQLIEVYKGVYDTTSIPNELEILIPRVFVSKIDSKSNKVKWGKVGNQDVDFRKIEFPEVVGDSYGEVRLMRGELYYRTNIKNPVEYPAILPGFEYPVVILDASLALQDREDLINGEYYPESLTDLDLYYHPEERNKIYHDLGLDPNKSYYELSKEMGFDLARFYEK